MKSLGKTWCTSNVACLLLLQGSRCPRYIYIQRCEAGAGRSGRHVFVLVGSNPTVVTNVKLVPSPEADDVAVTSSQSLMPCRDR